MASLPTNIPTQRSYQEILGDMVDTLLSKLNISGVKVGGPLLTVCETIATSQARTSNDIFQLLASQDINTATGDALTQIGAQEGLVVQGATYGIGYGLVVTDPSVTPVVTSIYRGTPAINGGAGAVNVPLGITLPGSGSIYIGRGTLNYEGPLAYSSITPAGSYQTVNLSGLTTRYHNVGESVIVAKGGNRLIQNGSTCSTSPVNGLNVVQYTVLGDYTILDGDNQTSGITVLSSVSGKTGNCSPNSIKTWVTPPFVGATINNPQAVSNALDQETPEQFRQRIVDVRSSRNLGTDLAITTGVVGATAKDESTTVVSANIVPLPVNTLYIDDGTGYEEKSVPVALENIALGANAGARFFQLADVPLAKAYLQTNITAPFGLVNGSELRVNTSVGASSITFAASQFQDILAATAFEVVTAINSVTGAPFQARVCNSGTSVAIQAKADTNEWIQVIPALSGVDANSVLEFPTTLATTLDLFKNDVLLNKDGLFAQIYSIPQESWTAGAVTNGCTLFVGVDGTGVNTYTFNDSDFVAIGYAGVSVGVPISAWCTVLNNKVPGITATSASGSILLTSNAGAVARAQIAVTGGTLIGAMFTAQTVNGAVSDYTLNRNTGDIALAVPLATGDVLTAGSQYTRAYIQSTLPSSGVTPSTGTANLWFTVDGNATIIPVTVAGGALTISNVTNDAGGFSIIYTLTAAGGTFAQVQNGDFVVLWDPALAAFADPIGGVFRVETNSSTYIRFKKMTAVPATGSVTLTNNGLAFVRTLAPIQQFSLAGSTTYNPATLATSIQAQLTGVDAYQVNSNSLRIATKTWDSSGQIALITADINGQTLPFTKGIRNNQTASYGYDLTQDCAGTPEFNWNIALNDVGLSIFGTDTLTSGVIAGLQANFGDSLNSNTGYAVLGSHARRILDYLDTVNPSGFLTTENTNNSNGLLTNWDRVYYTNPYAITPTDTLSVIYNNDTTTSSYNINLGYPVKPIVVGGNIGYYYSPLKVQNLDSSSLNTQFGAAPFNFQQFRYFSRARATSFAPSTSYTSGVVGALSPVLFRLRQYGLSGSGFNNGTWAYNDNVYVRWVNPNTALAPITVTGGYLYDSFTGGFTVKVQLPSTASTAAGGFQQGQGYAWFSDTIDLSGHTNVRPTIVYCGVSSFNLHVTSTNNVQVSSIGSLLFSAHGQTHGFKNGDQLYLFADGAYPATPFPNGFGTVIDAATPAGGFTFAYNNPSICPVATTTHTNTAYQVMYVTDNVTIPTAPSWGSGTVAGTTILANQTILGFSSATSVPSQLQAGLRAVGFDTPGMWAVFYLDSGNLPAPNGYKATPAGSVDIYNIDTAKTIITARSTLYTDINGYAGNQWVDAGPLASWTGPHAVGTGPVVCDSFDLYAFNSAATIPTDWTTFTGGETWIAGTTYASSNYGLNVAHGAVPTYISDEDWAHETGYIVPATPGSLKSFLNTPAISGLGVGGLVDTANNAHKLELATKTIGSTGSVLVAATKSNGATANVIGSALVQSGAVGSSMTTFNIPSASAIGFKVGEWVALQNNALLNKPITISGASAITVTAGVSTSTLTIGTGGWGIYWGSTAAYTSNNWLIEKQGKYACYIYTPKNSPSAPSPVWGTPTEESWLVVTDNGTVNSANVGAFRIVKTIEFTGSAASLEDSKWAIWVENPNAVEQYTVINQVEIFDGGSTLIGDTLQINGPVLGAANAGSYKVLGYTVVGGTTTAITVQGVLTPVGPVTLGTAFNQIQVVEGVPSRIISKIGCLQPDGTNPGYYTVGLTTQYGVPYISAGADTQMIGLDKLDFSTIISDGIDAYRVNTGLIAECNKIVYGSQLDPVTYPGILADGSNININGPIIERIYLSLAVRIGQQTAQSIIPQVQTAIANLVNSTPIGTPIALSSVIDAASGISGVESVIMISPALTDSTDLISVPAGTKPMVINMADITVTALIG